MAKVTLYHNPKCSKSRQTLSLLKEKGCDIESIELFERHTAPLDSLEKFNHKEAEKIKRDAV